MNGQPKETATVVQEKVEAVVARGQDVRSQVSHLVCEAAEKSHRDKDGLTGLARSVMDGTARAIDKAVPHDPVNMLRQVVDGLGDGLSTAALASQLALEEARARGQKFAAEDLAKLKSDLQTIGDMFVETVSGAAGQVKTTVTAQLHTLREHAERTRRRIMPSIDSALAAAQQHPLQLGKESVEAGWAASRQALGALFAAVGRSMQEASKRLTGEETGK